MRKTVLCPIGLNGYDTDIQFDDFNSAFDYALSNHVLDFAILDSLSLEYYGSISIY